MKIKIKFFLLLLITTNLLNGKYLIFEDFITKDPSIESTEDLDLAAEDFFNKHPKIRFFLFSDESHKLVNFPKENMFWQGLSVALGYFLFKYSFSDSTSNYSPSALENALAGFSSQMISARIAGKHVSLKAYLVAVGICIACDFLKGN
jgi:hypothetical protein